MIIAKTPFRVSFCGGGSDLKEFYSKGYGAVVSTTIDKYMYITIHEYFHDKIRIKYSKVEDVDRVENIRHPLVRECLKKVEIDKGIEIASIADVPAGTGLGSSSSFTVCLLHSLYKFKGMEVSKERLAQEACEIEIEILKEPIGKQDQYAASFGGLNYIRFNRDESVHLEPLEMDESVRKELEKNFLLFYLGNVRNSSAILTEQKSNIGQEDQLRSIRNLVELADELRVCLPRGDIEGIARILNAGWALKKGLASNVSNPRIDALCEKGIAAGALGCKVLGAGGGGFLLFLCSPENQDALREALNMRELSFHTEGEGSKIIYQDG